VAGPLDRDRAHEAEWTRPCRRRRAIDLRGAESLQDRAPRHVDVEKDEMRLASLWSDHARVSARVRVDGDGAGLIREVADQMDVGRRRPRSPS